MANRLKWFFGHPEEALCAFLFGLMAIITFANVVTRYLLRYSFAFTEELVVSFFVWVTLLGASIAFREGSHLGFTFITDRLPRQLQKSLIWVSAGLAVLLFIFLIFFSIRQVGEEISLEITSSGIGVPQWWYTIGVPVWSILVIWRIFQGAARSAKKIGSS